MKDPWIEEAIFKFESWVFARVPYRYIYTTTVAFYLGVGVLVGWTIAGFLYH